MTLVEICSPNWWHFTNLKHILKNKTNTGDAITFFGSKIHYSLWSNKEIVYIKGLLPEYTNQDLPEDFS